MEWGLTVEPLRKLDKQGFVRIGKKRMDNPMPYSISYLSTADVKRVEKGILKIVGDREDGTKIVVSESGKQTRMQTVWTSGLYDAGAYGKTIVNGIIPKHPFPYPKSLYAVHDTIRFFVSNKPNALIVDFFAGSGTTLHAVNLLNAEDGGNRQCIMVTNNEVSADEETRLKAAGYHPGYEEWDKWGIARYVNWPRTKCSILGKDINGEELKGSYQTYLKQEKERERIIKQISLIDDPSILKTSQKKELVALCCQGKLPQSLVKADTKYIVSEEHTCSMLFSINYAKEWLEQLDGQDHITEFYVVTRNNDAFKRLKEDIQYLLGNIVEEEPLLRPMSEGFAANVKYFKLSFLDKYSVALHRQFRELLPLLWMKSGAIGKCPELPGQDIPDFLVFAENEMSILTNEDAYGEYRAIIENRRDIKTIFIIAKSEHAYLEMAQPFTWATTYHLYKDYLDNFSINYER